MSEHLLKTIEMFEAELAQQEEAAAQTRAALALLYKKAGMQPKFDLSDAAAMPMSGSTSTKHALSVRPDEFFGRPQATCVREALTKLKSVGRAPAGIDAIYEVLLSGGFDFEGRGKDAAMNSLSISIGKNSALFVKLPNNLIGVKEWYPGAKQRVSKSNNGKAESAQADVSPSPEPEQENEDAGTSPEEGAE